MVLSIEIEFEDNYSINYARLLLVMPLYFMSNNGRNGRTNIHAFRIMYWIIIFKFNFNA